MHKNNRENGWKQKLYFKRSLDLHELTKTVREKIQITKFGMNKGTPLMSLQKLKGYKEILWTT